MANQVSTADVTALISSAIGRTFDTSSGDAIKQKVFPQFLKEAKTKHARYISEKVAYFGEVPNMPEGTSLQYDDFKVDSLLTITPDDYGMGVRFTKQALADMAAMPFGEFTSSKLVAAERLGKAFRNSCSQTQDVLAAQVLISAQSATATSRWIGAGRDGKALAATDHPILANTSILGGTTFSNVGAAASLSQATLQTLVQTLVTIPSDEGLVRNVGNKYKLVVGPSLMHTAYTAVETAKKYKSTSTTDHDIPGLSNFDIDVIVNPFLGASSTVYALFGPDHEIKYWERQAPKIEDEYDFETKGHRWSVDFRFKVFFEDARDFIHSAGA